MAALKLIFGPGAAIALALSMSMAGESTRTSIYVGPTPAGRGAKPGDLAAVADAVALSRKTARLLSERHVSIAVFDLDEPEEERVARIGSRGGGVYIRVACLRSPVERIRIRYPQMPPDVYRHLQGPIPAPGPAISEHIAVERAKSGARLARLMSERFLESLGVSAPVLEASAGDYALDSTAGTAVVVELGTGAAPGSGNLCLHDSAATAMSDAVEAFLARPREQ